MDKTNENTTRTNAPENLIVLGAASIETKGGGIAPLEPFGENVGLGISEE